MSRLTRTQNRKLSFRSITYNIHRLTNLAMSMMFSTKPYKLYTQYFHYPICSYICFMYCYSYSIPSYLIKVKSFRWCIDKLLSLFISVVIIIILGHRPEYYTITAYTIVIMIIEVAIVAIVGSITVYVDVLDSHDSYGILFCITV